MSSRLELAAREHVQSAELIITAVRRIHDVHWHASRDDRSWTPAQEVAHVLLAYDFGTRAANGTMAMQMRRPAWVSALSRAVLIPYLLQRARFPSGGVSPEELDPLRNRMFETQAADRSKAIQSLQLASDQTQLAFECAAADAPHRRIVHAYFGGLSLESGWRLLSAHTRHHAALLAQLPNMP